MALVEGWCMVCRRIVTLDDEEPVHCPVCSGSLTGVKEVVEDNGFDSG